MYNYIKFRAKSLALPPDFFLLSAKSSYVRVSYTRKVYPQMKKIRKTYRGRPTLRIICRGAKWLGVHHSEKPL